MIKRILVPVDFSEISLEALEHAVELARSSSADLLLVHVVEPVYYTLPAVEVLADQKAFARVELDCVVQKLAARKIACRTILRVGNPYIEIVKAAREGRADLIVMATHGRTGFSHLMMGSVAERVVRTSACPVLTVPVAKRSEKDRRQGSKSVSASSLDRGAREEV